MFYADAVAMLKSRCARFGLTALDATIGLEMQSVVSVFCEPITPRPHWLLSEANTALTIANDRRVPLPTDYLALPDVGALEYIDSVGVNHEIRRKSFLGLLTEYGEEASGAPKHYDLFGKYFMLFPKPDAEYTLQMYYYMKDTISTTDSPPSLWLTNFPEIVIAKTMYKLAVHVQNPTAMKIAQDDYNAAAQSIRILEIEREEAGLHRAFSEES